MFNIPGGDFGLLASRVFSRRDLLLRIAGGAGSALVAPALFGLASRHALAQDASPKKRRKHLVILWLDGGPSQIDTFDPKPDTKAIGPSNAIETGIDGWQMAEHLPRIAKSAPYLSLIRTVTCKEGSHGRANDLLHFGYTPNPSVEYPSLGAIATHEIADLDYDLPAFVQIGGVPRTAGHLGAQYSPFWIDGEDTAVDNLAYREGVTPARMDAREQVRTAIDAQFRQTGGTHAVDVFEMRRRAARRLMDSELRTAFDLSQEPKSASAPYGASAFGKSVLLARRLIEHGVTAVEVELRGWDTHLKNFDRTRFLCKQLDPALAALIADLRERDLYDDTLVLCMGEFGRTPTINADDGRDHWPNNFCALLAGCGIKPGVVVGETDERSAEIAKRPVQVADLFATMAQVLGVERDKEFNPTGRRPNKLIDPDGMVVSELIA